MSGTPGINVLLFCLLIAGVIGLPPSEPQNGDLSKQNHPPTKTRYGTEKIPESSEQMQALSHKLEEFSDQIQTLSGKVQELAQQNQVVSDKNQALSIKNNHLETMMSRLERHSHSMSLQLHDRDMSKAGLVMFQAYRDTTFTGSASENSPIPFDSIVFNIGGAYNGNTGVFTAPVSGYYQFSHQVVPNGVCGTERLQTRATKNGGLDVYYTNSVFPNTQSRTEAVHLTAGDTTWIALDNTYCLEVAANPYNGFYGYLLHQDI